MPIEIHIIRNARLSSGSVRLLLLQNETHCCCLDGFAAGPTLGRGRKRSPTRRKRGFPVASRRRERTSLTVVTRPPFVATATIAVVTIGSRGCWLSRAGGFRRIGRTPFDAITIVPTPRLMLVITSGQRSPLCFRGACPMPSF